MFISIDGIDGTGKTTQLKRLADYLVASGCDVCLTREPGGTPAGVAIRSILLDKHSDISPTTELLLFCADRAEHQRKIADALGAGQVVLCDRFLSSTIAYQIYGRGFEKPEMLEYITKNTVTLFPDITIILDLPVDVSIKRSLARLNNIGSSVSEGRFESESKAFFERVRAGFMDYAKKYNAVVLDASGNEDDVFNAIKRCVDGLFG
ncbi:dTMP kinase [Deferribacterales bacterium RsTz2092]|nr:thymidylate kinase [Deferribacterales bacterium]